MTALLALKGFVERADSELRTARMTEFDASSARVYQFGTPSPLDMLP